MQLFLNQKWRRQCAALPTIKTFQPSPRLALPTLKLGTQLKALAATGTITPHSAIPTKINLNLAALLALENKTSAACAYKNRYLWPFSWRVALCIFRPKCNVLLTTVTSPVLHTTQQAGASHWIKHLTLTSLGSGCFSTAHFPSIILTRLIVKTNRKRKEQKSLSQINVKIQKVLHWFLKMGIYPIHFQQNLPYEKHSRPYFHLKQQNEYFN